MVSRLPPQSRALRAPARGGVSRRLRAAAGPARARHAPGGAIQDSEAHELFDMSSVNDELRGDWGLGAGDSDGSAPQSVVSSPLVPSPQPPSPQSPSPQSPQRAPFWRSLEER